MLLEGEYNKAVDQTLWMHRLVRDFSVHSCADPEGGQGVRIPPTPFENYKNIGFLSNTCPDPLKITKLPIQHSMLGLHWPASETPFKWRANDGSLIVVFGFFIPSSN